MLRVIVLFPTVSAGWTISNEDFFKDIKPVFSYLKLRGSVGQVGSDRGIPAHQFLSAMEKTSNVYNFGNAMGAVGGYLETQIANQNVTWEKAMIYNIGIESRMFNDQLSLTAEYFKDQRNDIYRSNDRIGGLYGLALQKADGKSKDFQQNIGSMYSQGTDIGVQWSSKIGDLTYNIGGTFSYSKNKIQEFGEADKKFRAFSRV